MELIRQLQEANRLRDELDKARDKADEVRDKEIEGLKKKLKIAETRTKPPFAPPIQDDDLPLAQSPSSPPVNEGNQPETMYINSPQDDEPQNQPSISNPEDQEATRTIQEIEDQERLRLIDTHIRPGYEKKTSATTNLTLLRMTDVIRNQVPAYNIRYPLSDSFAPMLPMLLADLTDTGRKAWVKLDEELKKEVDKGDKGDKKLGYRNGMEVGKNEIRKKGCNDTKAACWGWCLTRLYEEVKDGTPDDEELVKLLVQMTKDRASKMPNIMKRRRKQ